MESFRAPTKTMSDLPVYGRHKRGANAYTKARAEMAQPQPLVLDPSPNQGRGWSFYGKWRWCRDCTIRKGAPWPEQAWAVARRAAVLARLKVTPNPRRTKPKTGGKLAGGLTAFVISPKSTKPYPREQSTQP